jgi:hypothetical protein
MREEPRGLSAICRRSGRMGILTALGGSAANLGPSQASLPADLGFRQQGSGMLRSRAASASRPEPIARAEIQVPGVNQGAHGPEVPVAVQCSFAHDLSACARVAAALVAATIGLGGTAAAAYAGVLPGPIQGFRPPRDQRPARAPGHPPEARHRQARQGPAREAGDGQGRPAGRPQSAEPAKPQAAKATSDVQLKPPKP